MTDNLVAFWGFAILTNMYYLAGNQTVCYIFGALAIVNLIFTTVQYILEKKKNGL